MYSVISKAEVSAESLTASKQPNGNHVTGHSVSWMPPTQAVTASWTWTWLPALKAELAHLVYNLLGLQGPAV